MRSRLSQVPLIFVVVAFGLLLLAQSLLVVGLAFMADRPPGAWLSEALIDGRVAVTFFFLGGLVGLVSDLWLSGSLMGRVFKNRTQFVGWHWGLWLSLPYLTLILWYIHREPGMLIQLSVTCIVLAFFAALGSFTGVYVGFKRPTLKEKVKVIFAIFFAVLFFATIVVSAHDLLSVRNKDWFIQGDTLR
jgi:hypothetical protein